MTNYSARCRHCGCKGLNHVASGNCVVHHRFTAEPCPGFDAANINPSCASCGCGYRGHPEGGACEWCGACPRFVAAIDQTEASTG